jgi:hypothetical protein
MSFAKTIPTFTGGSQLVAPGDSSTPALSDLLKDMRGHQQASVGLLADGAASTTTAETAFYVHQGDTGKVAAVRLIPSGAATADATTYATITVRKRNGQGGAASTIGTLLTNVAGGSWVAFTTKSFTGLTNTALVNGDVLTYEVSKASTGVQLPASRLIVDISAP